MSRSEVRQTCTPQRVVGRLSFLGARSPRLLSRTARPLRIGNLSFCVRTTPLVAVRTAIITMCIFATVSCNADKVLSVNSDALVLSMSLTPATAAISNGETTIRIRVNATNPAQKRATIDLGAPTRSSYDFRTNRGTLFGYRVYISGTQQPIGPSTDTFGNSAVATFDGGETKTQEFQIDVMAPFGLGLAPGSYDVVGVYNRTASQPARLVIVP